MNVLVTGKGGDAGSWHIRAIQLGNAIGARVQPLPMVSLADCSAAEIIVVVKRTPPPLIDTIRRSGKPWVLDLVDGWPQPCDWDEARSVAWLQQRLQDLQPTGVVFGTERMRADSGWVKKSWLVLPHHSWDRYTVHQPVVRPLMRTLGYEGVPAYLGRWHAILERECRARDLQLMINGNMRHADVGIALRDTGGYPARWWKPNTKLSNLHALGIPALCSREAGYESVACGREYWIETESDLAAALDQLESLQVRQTISTAMRRCMITVESVAATYREWLQALVSSSNRRNPIA